MNRVSVSWGTWDEAKGHFPGTSQRTASPGLVQIRVDDPNGAAVCTACPRVPMFLSLIFAGGSRARIETAMGETRRWMNFVTWLSVFYMSAAFQRSKGRRNPPIIGQERRYCATNPWAMALKMNQLRSRELGVQNAHVQFPHTRANRSCNPIPVQAPYPWCPSRSIVHGVGVREWWERSKPTF